MDLTIAEFCRFNIKSRIHLINKDGLFLNERKVYNVYRIKLYRVYQFYIEVVTLLNSDRVLQVEPVINNEIVKLYLCDSENNP